MRRDLTAKDHKLAVIRERLQPLPCGTGKSHLAQALGHIAVRRGYDTVSSTHAKLLGQLASARAVGTYERKLATLTKADLLIIDDFGLKPMRSWQDEDFHDVIAERYERKPTIIPSNLDFSEWNDAFHNKLLGAATLDLIMHARRLPGRAGRQELQDSSQGSFPLQRRLINT